VGAPLLSSSQSSLGVQQAVTTDTRSRTVRGGDSCTVLSRLQQESSFPEDLKLVRVVLEE
jgi:hypothetical protein